MAGRRSAVEILPGAIYVECSTIVDRLVAYWQQNVACLPATDRLRIATPFQRPGGDLIDIYIRDQGDGTAVVSDLGESLGFLVSMGYDPRSGNSSAAMLRQIVAGHEVELSRRTGVIRVQVAGPDVPEAVHRVLEAAIAVSHLLYLSRGTAVSSLPDELGGLLVRAAIQFEPDAIVKGQSGKRLRVDYLLHGGHEKMGYVKGLSAESQSGRTAAVNATFRTWAELEYLRHPRFTIVDDRYADWPGEDVRALERFSTVFRWGSEQDRIADEFRRFAQGAA